MTLTVILRDVQPSDLPIFYEHQSDPVAVEMADFPSRGKEAFMAHWANILADEQVDKQTILCDGQLAGNIVSFGQPDEREVGYWVGREFWGQGIATLALRAFLQQIAIRPLYARVVKHNIASRRVLEKCGFVQSGESGQEIIFTLPSP